jgi:hypothetical protein
VGRSVIGAGLAIVLTAIAVYSAVHHALLGVILTAPPALLFLLAVIDNRFVYRRAAAPDGERGATTPESADRRG